MTISFACPGCEKAYEVAASLAGKKGKCKQCGTPFAIPSLDAFLPDEDSDAAYQIEGGPGNPSTLDARTDGPVQELLLEPGDRVGTLSVVECSDSFFILKSRDWRLIGNAILGLGGLILGLVFVLGSGHGHGQGQGQAVRISYLLLLLPLAGIHFGLEYLTLLTRVGYRLTFDREERSLGVRRLFFRETTWLAEDLAGLVFLVSKARHAPGDYYAQYYNQYCEALVVDPEGAVAGLIDLEYHHHPDRIENLARATAQAARTLGLPIGLELRGEPLYPEIEESLKQLHRQGAREGGDRVPLLRKPVITENSVAFVLSTTGTTLAAVYLLARTILNGF